MSTVAWSFVLYINYRTLYLSVYIIVSMLDTIREAIISFATITIPQAVQMIGMSWVDFWTSGGPIMNGIILQAVIIGLIIALIRLFPHSAFATLMDVITEKVYDFFEEIIGKKASSTVKIYVVTLFFIIIISNLLGLVIDFVKLPFPIVEELFAIPTGNINFNLALSIVSIIIVLIIQRKSLGGGFTFFNEYVPLWGKGILTLERGNMSP
jgi:F0F1-type ATP synthase membrane subunit a